jgi:hypothetical protein
MEAHRVARRRMVAVVDAGGNKSTPVVTAPPAPTAVPGEG